MARLPWLGLPFPPALRRPESETEGLVLSGGGARASFQIGALRYLYDEAGIAPTVMVGASAGAILATALAQHATPEGQRQVLAQLEALWLDLREQSDMFAEREWFRRLKDQGTTWSKLFAADGEPKQASRLSIALPRRRRADPAPDEDETTDGDGPGADAEPSAHDVLERLVSEVPSSYKSSIDWTPTLVTQLMNLLPQLGRTPAALTSIYREARLAQSMYRPGPILQRLLDPEVFTAERVASSGIVLRIAVIGLATGELHFATESGTLVNRRNVPLHPDNPVDLTLALLASCSIPGIFRPVRLGDELHVDGGVRESLPAEMAMGPLGVDRLYAIASGPSGVPHQPFDNPDIVELAGRATAILYDEALRDEVAYARSAGAIVIEPELDIHDAFTVDPGLIRINMAYGAVRAAEVHREASPAEVRLHRQIFLLRRDAWDVECTIADAHEAMPGEAATKLARMKLDLREALALARPGMLPADADEWWQHWEHHADPITERPFWLSETADDAAAVAAR